MNASTRMLLPLVIAMLLAPLTACAATASSKALEGKGLGEGLNKPVANAMGIVP